MDSKIRLKSEFYRKRCLINEMKFGEYGRVILSSDRSPTLDHGEMVFRTSGPVVCLRDGYPFSNWKNGSVIVEIFKKGDVLEIEI